MAEQILSNAFVSINGVNLSDHVRSVRLGPVADLQEITAMSDTFKARLAGLKDWVLELEFNQDYAVGSVDATLWAAWGVSVAIEVRADAGVASATNPKWTGNAILESYPPINGSVGAAHAVTANFQGNGTLTRATA